MSENILGLLRDMHSARKQGPAAISQRQRARLSEMIAFARANSPYYRELYHDLPERVEDPTLLPVTSKKALMEHFDDWVTDREVTYEKVHAFVDNPNLIGERFLDKCLVATTSGSSGTRGIFVIDDRTLDVATAASICMMLTWLNAADILRLAVGSGRTALVIATGGHFTGAASMARLRKSSPGRTKRLLVLSAQTPLPDVVAQLNHFHPVMLGGYASILAMLADEQETGRLQIHPVLISPSSEGLSHREYDRIAGAFKARSAPPTLLPSARRLSRRAAGTSGCTLPATGACWRPSTPTFDPYRPASNRTRCC